MPYYGRAWSTATSALHAKNISGTKNGASTTVVYATARQYAADHGKQRDPVEGAAWTAYKRQNCTAKYGCVTPWREIYYDDATALGQKYDLVNRDEPARRRDLGARLRRHADRAVRRCSRPSSSPTRSRRSSRASSISGPFVSANGDGRMDTVTVRATVTGHIKFGWAVARLTDGVAGPAIRSGSVIGKTVAFTWDGRDAAGKLVGDGRYRITVWAADVSNNRASVAKVVTVDRRPAAVSLASPRPGFLSPDGDGHDDTIGLCRPGRRGRSPAPPGSSTGPARPSGAGRSPRPPPGAGPGTAATRPARSSPTAATRSGSIGLDRAGNQTSRDLRITVDRTIKSLTWARSSFTPRAGPDGPLHADPPSAGDGDRRDLPGFDPGPHDLERAQASRPGTYGWTWNGKTAAGLRSSSPAATRSSSRRRAGSAGPASSAASPSRRPSRAASPD